MRHWVHGGSKFVRVLHLGGGTVSRTNTGTHVTHTLFEQLLHGRAITARVAFDDDGRGNGVADAIGDEFGTRHHGRRLWIHTPRHNGLQGQHDFGTNHQRVNHAVGRRGVPTTAMNGNHEVVFAGHDAAGAGSKLPCRQAGHVVHTVDSIHGEARQHAVVEHGFGAMAVFFVGLEHKVDRARQLRIIAEQGGRSQ